MEIPVGFIKQLGIFEFRKDVGQSFLDVHLTYLVFCCASSMCQKGLNIQQEMAKLKDRAWCEAGSFSNHLQHPVRSLICNCIVISLLQYFSFIDLDKNAIQICDFYISLFQLMIIDSRVLKHYKLKK